jgi:hypothetical protein
MQAFTNSCPSENPGTNSTPREVSVRKGGLFRSGAYSLAPRHFRIAQRRTERCQERACPPSETQDKFACRREGLRGDVPMYRRACPEPVERAERRDSAPAATEGSGKSGWRSDRPTAEGSGQVGWRSHRPRTETNSVS